MIGLTVKYHAWGSNVAYQTPYEGFAARLDFRLSRDAHDHRRLLCVLAPRADPDILGWLLGLDCACRRGLDSRRT